MDNISQLSPQPIWQFFSQICRIPHPSRHEQQISAWLQSWAKGKGLTVVEDEVGNVIIKKPATQGMENRKCVVLQAHMDMVPQKNNDTVHDFTTDPIKPYVDGEWVTAEGTTLGADNGIGLSSALAVFDSNDLPHGPLELLITINEEAGMDGAFGLKPGLLDAEILINTDSEQEGEVYMGCAGGLDAIATFTLDNENVPNDYLSFNLSITGLKGGHSGCDIHTGRDNANKLLVRYLLQASQKFAIQLTELNGGSLRNAIPREANASFVMPVEHKEALEADLVIYLNQMKQNLSAVEPDIDMLLMSPEDFDRMWTTTCQSKILNALNASPNGVMRMSDEISSVVETSVNLGVLRCKGNKFICQLLIRSLHDDGRLQLEEMIRSIFALAGADVKFTGGYPGWAPNKNSPIMKIVRSTYETIFGRSPDIMVIHAGLECGLLKKPYPHWDMVSIGPTIRFPHSPDEKVHIGSVDQYWQLLKAILAEIPEK